MDDDGRRGTMMVDHGHDSDVARPSCMMIAGHAMAGEAGGGETFHYVPHFQFWTPFHSTDALCQAMCKNLQAAEAWRVSSPG